MSVAARHSYLSTQCWGQGRAKLRAFPHHLARENTQLSPSLTPTLGIYFWNPWVFKNKSLLPPLPWRLIILFSRQLVINLVFLCLPLEYGRIWLWIVTLGEIQHFVQRKIGHISEKGFGQHCTYCRLQKCGMPQSLFPSKGCYNRLLTHRKRNTIPRNILFRCWNSHSNIVMMHLCVDRDYGKLRVSPLLFAEEALQWVNEGGGEWGGRWACRQGQLSILRII